MIVTPVIVPAIISVLTTVLLLTLVDLLRALSLVVVGVERGILHLGALHLHVVRSWVV